MTRCSVLECKNSSGTKNLLRSGISYHRFPKDPHLKEKWINATGRINWMPTKSSCICSEHFAENEILITIKGYRYLDPNVVPTKKIMSYQDIIMTPTSSKQNILDEPGPSSEPPTKKPCISIINVKSSGKATTSTSKELFSANKSPSSSLCSSPKKKKLGSMLRITKSMITKKNLKIKSLQAQNRRLKRKLENIEQLLKTLEDKLCPRTNSSPIKKCRIGLHIKKEIRKMYSAIEKLAKIFQISSRLQHSEPVMFRVKNKNICLK